MSKLNNLVLPQYEDVLVRWFNGTPIHENEPGIMQRMSRKSHEEPKPEDRKEEEEPSQPAEDAHSLTSQIHSQAGLKALYTSEAYLSRLEDTAYLVKEFN